MRAIATLAAASFLPICATAQPELTDSGALDSSYPVVITPTRLRQALPDVPASVTVITSAQMARLGINSIAEALRLVPGMELTRASGADWRIGYHGTNILTPRRMNVLVDGVSMYRPAYSRVLWQQFPIAIADVDRIEVTRGSNSASYGPNSMLAIVNIITKHPKDVEHTLVSVVAGSNDIAAATLRMKRVWGSTVVRVSANAEHDGGYDKLTRSDPQGHNATRYKRLNAKSTSELSKDSTLDLQAAFVEGVNEVPFTDASQATFPDMRIRDYFLAGKWTTQLSPTHELQVMVNHTDFGIDWRWITCPPTATFLPEMYELARVDRSYADAILAGRMPRGGTAEADALAAAAVAAIKRLGARARAPTCVAANHDIYEERTDVELQDTFVLSEQARVVSGVGARRQRVRSPTLFGSRQSATLFRVFANAELKARPWLHFNFGGYGEHDDQAGWTWSPRAAVNARLTDTQSVRLVLSKGTRTPDLYEQRADWTYNVSGATPPLNGATDLRFFLSAQSPGGLRPERVVSRELGYMLMVPRLGMTLDAKLFDDRLNHLISEKLQASDFQPTNRNRVRLTGAELQATAELGGGWNGFVNYAFLRNHAASTPLERAHYSRHSGAAGIGRSKEGAVAWSLAYYGASGDGLGQNSYGRTDLTLAKVITVQSARVRGSATISRLDNKTVTYFRDFGSTLENRYDSRLQLRAQLDVSF
jgi:iron complex outermembrane receptor protein